MRGRDRSSGNFNSATIDLEERVPDDHPLRLIREIVNDVLGSLSSEFETLYSHIGSPIDPAGEASSSVTVAGVLFDPLGASADGAAKLQHAVSLVCGAWAGRWRVGRQRVLPQPGPSSGGGGFGAAACGGYPAPQGRGTIEPGSFFGRRNIDRGLGVDEELSSQR